MALPQQDTEFIKIVETARGEVDEMAEYLGVSDRKQIGQRILLKGHTAKYDLHEFLLAIAKKLQGLEDAKTKRKRDSKTVDKSNKPSKGGAAQLEGTLPS